MGVIQIQTVRSHNLVLTPIFLVCVRRVACLCVCVWSSKTTHVVGSTVQYHHFISMEIIISNKLAGFIETIRLKYTSYMMWKANAVRTRQHSFSLSLSLSRSLAEQNVSTLFWCTTVCRVRSVCLSFCLSVSVVYSQESDSLTANFNFRSPIFFVLVCKIDCVVGFGHSIHQMWDVRCVCCGVHVCGANWLSFWSFRLSVLTLP